MSKCDVRVQENLCLWAQKSENGPSQFKTTQETKRSNLDAFEETKHEQVETKATEVVAAIILQCIMRGQQARWELTQIKFESITIVDAKDSGLEWLEVDRGISTIARKELKDDEGIFGASSYVQKNYFRDIPIEPGLRSPEFILIAQAANAIVGFIITGKRVTTEADEDDPYSLSADTGYVAYLAVDSTIKRSGIGTKLMLAIMRKTKEMGKRYLTLEYIAKGAGVDQKRGEAKIEFYNSFTKRFGIPMNEKGNHWLSRQLHVCPFYDLQNVDFRVI